jgi:hypothetical protein
MRRSRVALGVCALGLLAATAGPADAAWNNVFQVCCHRCRPSASGYLVAQYPAAAAPSACCPQPVCANYVQRCYYQPVTSYTTQTYYEPVTTYRTSYFYEPVTSYRYSYYVDPCTGCTQAQVCPTTCYQLKSKCCPVQSWVQRCCQVPVTTYQKSCYWEQVNPCCTPTAGVAVPSTPAIAVPGAPPVPGAPGVPPPPQVGGNGFSPSPPPAQPQTPAPPMVEGSSAGTLPQSRNGAPVFDRSFSSPGQPMPQGSPRPSWDAPNTGTPVQNAPRPAVKLERIVSGPTDALVEGTVVRTDNAPKAGARVVFVSADRYGVQQDTATNDKGRFRVTLDQGSWYIYLTGADGRQAFHSRIEVSGNRTGQLTLLSR